MDNLAAVKSLVETACQTFSHAEFNSSPASQKEEQKERAVGRRLNSELFSEEEERRSRSQFVFAASHCFPLRGTQGAIDQEGKKELYSHSKKKCMVFPKL